MSPNDEERAICGGGGGGEEVADEDSEQDGDMDEDEEELEVDLTVQPPEDDDEDEEEEDIISASPSTSTSSEDNPNKDSSTNAAQENPTITTTTTAAAAAVSSSAIPPSATAPNGTSAETAPPATGSSPDHEHQRTSDIPPAAPAAAAAEEKKPPALDDSRRLFQRLWTDEDEIGLLQGFLEYTMQRGSNNSSHHHDTAPFYDQIKTRLQLDFNKNQLVEKLRRLKKKYRNVLSRISSGKEFSFKSPHDQATFEISRKIWSGTGSTVAVGVEEAVSEDDEGNPNPASHNTTHTNCNENFHNSNYSSVDANNSDKKMSRSRKRSRKGAAEDNLSNYPLQTTSSNSIPNVIEDTVRSCLSPLFKELLHCAMGGPCSAGGGGGYGGLALNPLPLSFGPKNSLNFLGGEVVDEKWRKQQILELEVYSKRIELVQDQIKSALEELRSMGD
ncbi:probable transcription factor At3g04930 [Macadamia integrifolia]|uniref:probable transcription factor At3g04930 n=1 Tax=Macadamia integrifolia TaxID=60698 RepID=UPI001C4F816B|nr:probable transcription factor At3g04930 [Macadamia integrifolia]